MKLILSPSAVRDLQSISDYTLKNWGADQEEHYLKGLWGKLAAIQAGPKSYQLRAELIKDCRSARHEKHVIFFAIHGQTLQIIRILHSSMDFRCHLPSEEPRTGPDS
jgi:toxin ParE1/3/4